MLLLLAYCLAVAPLSATSYRQYFSPAPDKNRKLYVVRVPAELGYVDKTNKLVIPTKFEATSRFSEGLAAVTLGGKVGYIDPKGDWVVRPRFASARNFRDGITSASIREDPLRAQKKWGIIDKKGHWVIKPQYDEEVHFFNGLGVVNIHEPFAKLPRVRRRLKTWVINLKNETVFEFDGILFGFQCPEYSIAKNDRRTFLVDRKGNEITISGVTGQISLRGDCFISERKKSLFNLYDQNLKPLLIKNFDYVSPISEGLMLVRRGKYLGYIDSTGKTKIPLTFKSAALFKNGLASVTLDNEKCTYINKTGQQVFDATWDSCERFHDGIALVSKKNEHPPHRSFFIDLKGNVLFERKEEDRDYIYSHGLRVFGHRKRYSFIDSAGTRLPSAKFDSAREFSDGMAVVGNLKRAGRNKYGYINENGEVVIPVRYDLASNFSEGLALVTSGNGSFFIDKAGKTRIKLAEKTFPCGGQRRSVFSEGIACIVIGGTSRYIDTKGKTLFQGEYRRAFPFREGLALVEEKRKGFLQSYSFFDKRGRSIAKPYYRNAQAFSEGLAAVQSQDDWRWGYIDKKANWSIPAKFSNAKSFSEGLAAVRIDPAWYSWDYKWGYINLAGRVVIGPQFERAFSFSHGLAAVQLAPEKWQYIDRAGNQAFPGTFTQALDFQGNLAKVCFDFKAAVYRKMLKRIYSHTDSRGWSYQNCAFINRRGKIVSKRFAFF